MLLGGKAGLGCGAIMALEWHDVDLHKRPVCVQRSDWKGPHLAMRHATRRLAEDGDVDADVETKS